MVEKPRPTPKPSFVGSLDSARLRMFFADAPTCMYEEGSVIKDAGVDDEDAYFIIEGNVDVRRTVDTDHGLTTITVQKLSPGRLFNDYQSFTREKGTEHLNCYIAASQVEVVIIDESAMARLKSDPKKYGEFMTHIARSKKREEAVLMELVLHAKTQTTPLTQRVKELKREVESLKTLNASIVDTTASDKVTIGRLTAENARLNKIAISSASEAFEMIREQDEKIARGSVDMWNFLEHMAATIGFELTTDMVVDFQRMNKSQRLSFSEKNVTAILGHMMPEPQHDDTWNTLLGDTATNQAILDKGVDDLLAEPIPAVPKPAPEDVVTGGTQKFPPPLSSTSGRNTTIRVDVAPPANASPETIGTTTHVMPALKGFEILDRNRKK